MHFVISVTEYPVYVTFIGTNDSFEVSWTSPATPVSGYEVFYVTSAGETHSAGNTTDTNLTVSGLSDVCSVFVVAYGGDSTSEHTLPSARSNVIYLKSKTVYCMLDNALLCFGIL